MPWEEPDLDLHIGAPAASSDKPRVEDGPYARIVPAIPGPPSATPVLPLFARDPSDDEPLIKAPATPRRPVAVRRTPEPRYRPAPSEMREPSPGLAPRFGEQPAEVEQPRVVRLDRPAARAGAEEICDARPRVVAAAIDVGILASIDLVVLYLTLRMAALPMTEWHTLPLVPLLVFLTLVKFGYLAAFTAIGGQSIGKMAAHVRVVTEQGGLLTPGRAMQRSLAAMVSFVTLGAAFLPALTGRRLALHDRVAGTRVVPARPA